MSVSSVASTSTAAAQGASRPDPMANVSQLLNMSSSDLRSALKSGSSLSDIASKQGVSRDDLLNAIESDLKNRPQRPGSTDGTSGTGATSTDDLAAEAAKIADTKGLPKHHGHHHHGVSGAASSSSGLTPTTTDPTTVSSQLDAGGAVDVML